MKNQKLYYWICGIRGKLNIKTKEAGQINIEVRGEGETKQSINIDAFTGQLVTYKRREKCLINITGKGGHYWAGTFDDLESIIFPTSVPPVASPSDRAHIETLFIETIAGKHYATGHQAGENNPLLKAVAHRLTGYQLKHITNRLLQQTLKKEV